MHPNLAKQRLKEGRLALGLGLRQARTVDIASAAATCGFDWLFIDMEHNAMSVDAAAQIAAAAPAMGVTPIVRVPGHEHYHATRLLDNGAQGIVAPHVDDAARRHGKHPGMGGVYDPPHMEKYVRMGMRFILGGSDLSLLMAAAKERAGFLRKAAGEAEETWPRDCACCRRSTRAATTSCSASSPSSSSARWAG